MESSARADLVVSSQSYLTSTESPMRAPAWIEHAFSSRGWESLSASAAEIAVDFVDGSGRAEGGGDYPQIEGIPGITSLPVIASARIPVLVLRYQRGSMVCAAEVADLTAPLAKAWAAHVSRSDAARTLGKGGRGQSDEKNTMLLMNDVLIRADLWQEGVRGGVSTNAARFRGSSAELLDELSTAGSR
jgi:hypothetical protein